MSAIITSQFRLETTKKIIENHQAGTGNDEYYLFTGKSDPWTPTSDTSADIETLYDNHYATRHSAWHNILSMIRIEPSTLNNHAISFATKRFNLFSGLAFAEYDDRDETLEFKTGSADDPAYYAMDDTYTVWMCLVTGNGVSTQTPSSGLIPSDSSGTAYAGFDDTIKECNDGYIWKRLYTIPQSYYKYVSSAFIPVPDIGPMDADARAIWSLNDGDNFPNSIDGAIYNIKLIDNNVTTSQTGTTVKVVGDGTNCTATPIFNGTVITGFKVTNPGSGYTEAHVELYGATGTLITNTTARVVIGPKGGFGFNPINELRAHFISVSTKLTQTQNGAFIADNGVFRQIGLIKNPTDAAGVRLSASEYGLSKALKFSVGDATTAAAAWTVGSTFKLTAVSATDADVYGIIDDSFTLEWSDNLGYYHYIKYHQNDLTGFSSVKTGDNKYSAVNLKNNVNPADNNYPTDITQSAKLGGADLDFLVSEAEDTTNALTATNPTEASKHLYDDVKRYSGDIIFLDNRTPVTRSDTQTETINLVLEI